MYRSCGGSQLFGERLMSPIGSFQSDTVIQLSLEAREVIAGEVLIHLYKTSLLGHVDDVMFSTHLDSDANILAQVCFPAGNYSMILDAMTNCHLGVLLKSVVAL